MKKTIILLVLIGLIATLFCMPSCASKENEFNFIFKYGYSSTPKNVLDTYKETYTKDMVSDPSVTIKMVLSGEELDSILQKMKEIDFFNYPDEFIIIIAPGSTKVLVTPNLKYHFKVEYEGEIKELWWNDEIVWQDEFLKELQEEIILENKEEVVKLYEFISLIRSIIENKEEYKELPKPRGAYV